ncbi:MAG: 30S ribosomal protein S15 [Nanoarchaeota archaeon]|nr:30S ribosomal protein S15 [Nanoarchaeota archaeon]MBU0962624.1 30S ribosomal protein S15 [Nanoarchaeota archaeon]
MARMHSRKRGKSGSHKPSKKSKPVWLRYQDKEIEQIILKLAKEEKSQSQIGIILRDSYGIPDVRTILNKKISKVLKENNAASQLPEDLSDLIKKEIYISKHLGLNKKDMAAKRGLLLTESKIHRLSKYYKKNRVLPADWKYSRDKAKLLIGL